MVGEGDADPDPLIVPPEPVVVFPGPVLLLCPPGEPELVPVLGGSNC